MIEATFTGIGFVTTFFAIGLGIVVLFEKARRTWKLKDEAYRATILLAAREGEDK